MKIHLSFCVLPWHNILDIFLSFNFDCCTRHFSDNGYFLLISMGNYLLHGAYTMLLITIGGCSSFSPAFLQILSSQIVSTNNFFGDDEVITCKEIYFKLGSAWIFDEICLLRLASELHLLNLLVILLILFNVVRDLQNLMKKAGIYCLFCEWVSRKLQGYQKLRCYWVNHLT